MHVYCATSTTYKFLEEREFQSVLQIMCCFKKKTVITRSCSTFENYLKYLSVNTIAIKYDKRKRF